MEFQEKIRAEAIKIFRQNHTIGLGLNHKRSWVKCLCQLSQSTETTDGNRLHNNVSITLHNVRNAHYSLYATLLYPLITCKNEGKDQESIHSSIRPGPGYHKKKPTIKHHKQESQEVIPFPAGDHKATINRQEQMINRNHK